MEANLPDATSAPPDGAVTADAPDVVELVPSRLYVLGTRIPLDERVSWAWPGVWGRRHPMNAYLLLEGDDALLVDPGPALDRELVGRQLQSLLPAGSPLSIFMTRSEFDTFGALPTVAELYEVEHLYAGGFVNLLDGYSSITKVDTAADTEHVLLERVGGGGSISVAEGRDVTVVKPIFRMITSYWLYDEATGTLFTSDAFGHGTTRREDSRVLGEGDDYDPTEARSYLFTKFWWLWHAGRNAATIADQLRDFFDSHEVNTIAPSRGYVIHGRSNAIAHHELVQEALAEVAAAAGQPRS